MSLPNTSDTSISSNSSPGNTSERKSANFSISAILSEDTGGSRRPSRERRDSSGAASSKSSPTQPEGRILLSEVGCVVMSPPNVERSSSGAAGSLDRGVPMSTPSRYTHQPYHFPPSSALRTPTSSIPTSRRPNLLNQSLSTSPFNISLLQALSSFTSSPTGREGGKEGGGGGGDIFSCDDSLGMLSTVAMYHSELSDSGEGEKKGGEGEGRGGGREEGVRERASLVDDGMARMRLESSPDATNTVVANNDRSSPPSSPSAPRMWKKGATPSILKRDRKRRRLSGQLTPHSTTDQTKHSSHLHPHTEHPSLSHTHTEHSTQLNTGFLSPTSTQKSPHLHKDLAFSPSIFLSRPQDTSEQKHPASSPKDSRTTAGEEEEEREKRPASREGRGCDRMEEEEEEEGNGEQLGRSGAFEGRGSLSVSSIASSESLTAPATSFATSTPIKQNKENSGAVGFHLSPTCLSPAAAETKRLCLRDSTYETSSGSDSEAPMRKHPSRSRSLHSRSKARTQLSPLLENACSPIAKMDHRPPSSLLTASYTTPTTSTFLPPGGALPRISVHNPHQPVQMPPTPAQIPISFPHQVPPVQFPFTCGPPHFPQPGVCMGMIPVHPNTLLPMTVSPLSPPYYGPPHALQAMTGPTTASYHLRPNPFYYYQTSQAYGSLPPATVGQKWGGSPLSTQWEKTGQIQSVPPWFIFEQNRPEGKRLRLTEAINRSLSETPSQNPKLPTEWAKYACGQTDDQRLLTQRARSFLQSGRRQLTFDDLS